MKKKYSIPIVASLVLMLLTLFVYHHFYYRKIVVVNTKQIIDEYEGFKEARVLYEKEIKKVTLKFEESKNQLNQLQEAYSSNASNKRQREKLTEELKQKQVQTYQLGAEAEKTAKELENKLLVGVNNKVDDFLRKYCEKNKIDAVIGLTNEGNILYGSPKIDITEEIIEVLNKTYLGELDE